MIALGLILLGGALRGGKIMAGTPQRRSLSEGHAETRPSRQGDRLGFLGRPGRHAGDGPPADGCPGRFRRSPTRWLCFTIVGTRWRAFLLCWVLALPGGIPTGVAAHYLIGPAVGLLFGAAVTAIPALRVTSMKKCLILAFVYVEIVSQPILAPTPILLKMTSSQTLQWYGGSFVMHLILALVLGAVTGYGLGRVPRSAGRGR